MSTARKTVKSKRYKLEDNHSLYLGQRVIFLLWGAENCDMLRVTIVSKGK